MKNYFIISVSFLLLLPHFGSSQDSSTNEPPYEVNRIHKPFSITKENLRSATTLVDLNEHYKPSWVREYISVEILTNHKGNAEKAVSKNDTLSQEQKDIMNRADMDIGISVNVHYIPENTLSHNDLKVIDFTLTINAEKNAKYPDGEDALNLYLKEKAIDKIPAGTFENYDLAAIKFTINEEGQVTDAHPFESIYFTSKDEKIDQLLVEAIHNMPRWEPAEYFDGTKVKQEFVLTVGSMENCVVNLLSIRP